MIDQEQLDELRECARLATPGPWHLGVEPPEGRENDTSYTDSSVWAEFDGRYLLVAESRYLENDARHIAAANPQTVAAMVDEIERLREENKKLRDKCSELGKYAWAVKSDCTSDGYTYDSVLAETLRERDEMKRQRDNERIDHEMTVKVTEAAIAGLRERVAKLERVREAAKYAINWVEDLRWRHPLFLALQAAKEATMDKCCGTCKWMSEHRTDDKRFRCVAPYPFWVRNTDEWGYDVDGVIPDFAYECETYQPKDDDDD